MDPAPPIRRIRPAVEKGVGRAVAKALSKGAADRFDTATSFSSALSAPASEREGISSIAVLPLTNLSGDREQEYFSDGMTEALIADLAKTSALKVISRTSVMRYKGSPKPLPEIARELGVEAVLEGSVLRAGDQVRITAQLVDAASDTHLWAETYDREVANILSLQGEVARDVAREIQITLTPEQETRLTRPRPVDREAHDAFLRGRYHLNRATPDELNKAINYFEEATEKDADYALAFAALAESYNYLGWLGGVAREVFPRAKRAAVRALEIDDTLAEAHAELGYTATFFDWDWAAAEQELRRAIELNPNSSQVHLHHSWYLGSQGRLEEARAAIIRASELDPLSLVINANMSNYFWWKRDYDGMLEQTRRTLELAPNLTLGLLFSGMAYCGKRLYDDAVAEFEKLVDLPEGGSGFRGYLGYSCAMAGQEDRAREILNELQELSKSEWVPSFQIALVFIGLQQSDQAFTWLDKAHEERAGPLFPYIRQVSLFDPLRDDPRFSDLLRRMDFSG
jgi:TolB-like protein/Tfp pilus assembly protein PilF